MVIADNLQLPRLRLPGRHFDRRVRIVGYGLSTAQKFQSVAEVDLKMPSNFQPRSRLCEALKLALSHLELSQTSARVQDLDSNTVDMLGDISRKPSLMN